MVLRFKKANQILIKPYCQIKTNLYCESTTLNLTKLETKYILSES
jgi:hypothetical protein